MYEDLSLITCSYNTPEVLDLCLKSYVFHHGNGPHKIIIIENSTNTDTQNLLECNNIPFVKNPGGTHSPSVDLGFQLAQTKYALLFDTDIVFKNNINLIFYFFKRHSLTLLGELQGDRGGFLLYPRVAPYFCLINLENIHASKIRFQDDERIDKTNSTDFFKNLPINNEDRNKRFYDVGSTFYEVVQRCNLKIANLEEAQNIVFHAESLSWTLQSGIEEYVQMGKKRNSEFNRLAMQYKDVDIKNSFMRG